MGLIESIKAGGIRLADTLNKVNDPFDDFTRPMLAKYARPLHELEAEFYQDLVGNFWGCDGQVLLHRIPLPQGSPLDMGDQAIWHGVYTAMLSLRYHLCQDSDKAKDTYGHIVDAAKGLRLHQTIHGESRPRLIRGVSDDQKEWQDDASNDSCTGHLLGIFFGWKFGPPTMQPVFAQLAAGIAAELHNNGDSLVRADGTPTTYGALEQGWKTDPLRITLALAVYAVAATLTKEKTFVLDYERLYRKYKALIPYPKVKLWWLDNHNDTHRAAIHLAILADLTDGEAYGLYVQGLLRIRRMVRKHGNVWINALVAWGTSATDPFDFQVNRKVLQEFSLSDKQYNAGCDNYLRLKRSEDERRVLSWPDGSVWEPRAILWDGKWMASSPLPRWAVRSQDFFWQRNLFSLDEGSYDKKADSRHNCGDWLIAYWLCKLTGSV